MFGRGEPGRVVFWNEKGMKENRSKVGDAEPVKFGPVTHGIDPDDDLKQALGRGYPSKCRNHRRFACGHSAEQATPGKVHMDLIGGTVKFFGKVLDGGLKEERVRQPALRRFPRRLHRDLLERFYVRIDPDEELVRIRSGRGGYKAAVARPNVDHHTSACMGQ